MDKKLLNQIKEIGYAVIPDVLTKEQCVDLKNICNEVNAQYGEKIAAEDSANQFHGKNTVKMIYNLHNKHSKFLELIDHPATLSYIKALLQEGSYNNSEAVILKLSSARSPGENAPAQQLHIDSGIPGMPVCMVLQVIFILDAFTKANGATTVVPKSHKRAAFAENGKRYDDEVSLEAPAGSVVIYDGGLWHGSGEKTAPGDRWGIIMTYARWFYKPSFDYRMNTPYKIFEKMTDTQKELLGFKFNPPIDEFTRLSRRSKNFEPPLNDYKLP